MMCDLVQLEAVDTAVVLEPCNQLDSAAAALRKPQASTTSLFRKRRLSTLSSPSLSLPKPNHPVSASLNERQRETVSFAEQEGGLDCATKRPFKRRVLEWLPLSSELSLDEKQRRWIQPIEHLSARSQMSQEAARSRNADAFAEQAGEQSLKQTYSAVYETCNLVSENTSSQPSRHHRELELPLLLASMAVGRFADVRGLEDRTVPLLALERRMTRAVSIRSIVECQKRVAEEDLAEMAQSLSQPARRLGECLAVVDATAAMIEYGQDVA